jgi:hypothetical protein
LALLPDGKPRRFSLPSPATIWFDDVSDIHMTGKRPPHSCVEEKGTQEPHAGSCRNLGRMRAINYARKWCVQQRKRKSLVSYSVVARDYMWSAVKSSSGLPPRSHGQTRVAIADEHTGCPRPSCPRQVRGIVCLSQRSTLVETSLNVTVAEMRGADRGPQACRRFSSSIQGQWTHLAASDTPKSHLFEMQAMHDGWRLHRNTEIATVELSHRGAKRLVVR